MNGLVKLSTSCMLMIALSTGTAQAQNMGSGSFNSCGPGTHYDSGGAGGAYTNNELITETYCSNVPGDCIQFTFTTFNTEACCDDLTIYDGPTTASPLIGTYAGTALPNGGTITSTSGCLTFVFDSDFSITRPGWAANYTCVPCPVPTCSDGIQNQGELGIDCGGPCPACPPVIQPAACATISQTLPTASTYKFYDDGGVGGDNCADQAGGGNYCNCNCFTITTICAPAGEFIVADFNEFAMWNTTSGWDWMRIYDNNTNAGTVLYDNSSTGPDNPFGDCGQGATVMNFCSTNECLTFEFWATSVVNRAGWDCDVSSTTIACTLPVEFLSFTGESQGLTNALTWTTVSEINNDYFIVEASSNNMESFNAIGVVDGAGNSNTEITYEFIDNNVTSDITYYRLRQFDFDGESDISSIIAVRSTRETISFFPNPAQNELKLNVSNVNAGNYRIVYTNILGSVVEEQIVIENGASIYQLDQFNNLTAGVYFVRVVAQDGTTIGVDKVIKE